ncbi:MAG: MATE family efflux transporter, partial [Treponema sp.]|nr:MATE family efflux transporter [Treponema sp.]
LTQYTSFWLLLSFYLRRKTICHISVRNISKDIRVLGKVTATGLPSLARQGLASIASIMLNKAASGFGVSAVAAMAIVGKIIMFIASMMIGIGQGFSPVSGYNYGAKRYDRVKKAYIFLVVTGACVMSVFAVLAVIFAPQIIRAFRDDPNVIAVGSVALRWQAVFLPLHSLIVGTNMLMQSTRHITQATFLSMNRQGVYFIPAILILPHLFGLFGVEISQAVADLFSTFTAIPYLIWFFKKLPKELDG